MPQSPSNKLIQENVSPDEISCVTHNNFCENDTKKVRLRPSYKNET